jgi:uncharacterized protein YfcZ (UPF0381/DUF406 family)
MQTLPAICDHCGTIFHSNAIGLGPNVRGLVIEDVGVGPCPGCGSIARIPDGTYDTVHGTLRMLLKDPASAQALQNLANILRTARQTQADPASVADRVEDEVPELLSFAHSGERSISIAPQVGALGRVVRAVTSIRETQ